MNGSNLINEADRKPFALCPICLRKVVTYLDLEEAQITERYFKLISTIEIANNTYF